MRKVAPRDLKSRLQRLHELADEVMAWHELAVREVRAERPAHNISGTDETEPRTARAKWCF